MEFDTPVPASRAQITTAAVALGMGLVLATTAIVAVSDAEPEPWWVAATSLAALVSCVLSLGPLALAVGRRRGFFAEARRIALIAESAVDEMYTDGSLAAVARCVASGIPDEHGGDLEGLDAVEMTIGQFVMAAEDVRDSLVHVGDTVGAQLLEADLTALRRVSIRPRRKRRIPRRTDVADL